MGICVKVGVEEEGFREKEGDSKFRNELFDKRKLEWFFYNII